MMEAEPVPETPFFTHHMCKTPPRILRLGFPVIYTTVITLPREYGSAPSAISSVDVHIQK